MNKPFVTSEAMENGHKIWNLGCEKSVYVRNTETNCGELAVCSLHLVGVQQVRCDNGGTESFFYGNWNKNNQSRKYFVQKGETVYVACMSFGGKT